MNAINDPMKALMALAIEKILRSTRTSAYEITIDTLHKKYHCYLVDCLEQPELLKIVLKEQCGESYDEIINSIRQELKEFSSNKIINKFLQVLLS
jgi:hypothetical protein